MFSRKTILVIIGITLLLASFNSILASSFPDGLERVADDLGFISSSRDSWSVFSDYKLPLANGLIATGLAGVLGVGITYLALTLIAKGLIKGKVVEQDEN